MAWDPKQFEARTFKAHIEQVPLSKIRQPEDSACDDIRQTILQRISLNMASTKHPFHHKTADGTIVDSDPTLLHLVSMLHDAPAAAPVIPDFYGFDPYAEE